MTKVKRKVVTAPDGPDDRVAEHGGSGQVGIRRELRAEAVAGLSHLDRDLRVLPRNAGRGRSATRSRPSRGSPIPAVVTAAVPSRRPLVTKGFSGSFGIAFLLQVIPAASSASWATLPVTPNGRRSTSSRWLSVPPDTIRKPSSSRAAASALRVARRSAPRSRGRTAGRPRGTRPPSPRSTCMSGPPCRPGKTALSIAVAYGVVQRMQPARGPRSVLWVVRVTTSANGTGDGCAPPAIEPGDVRRVDEQQRPDVVGDRTEGRRSR